MTTNGSLAEQLAPVREELVQGWTHAKTTSGTSMIWNHPKMRKFVIGIDHGGKAGDVRTLGSYSWAKVGIGSHMPGEFGVSFAANLDASIVLQARGNEVTQSFGELPDLRVKVEWDTEGCPKTRVKDQDNLDHFIINENCEVMQLQTSLVTRGGIDDYSFYLCNQDLWFAQVVQVLEKPRGFRTHEIDGKHYATLNLWADQSYPGANFLSTNFVTGPKVLEAIIQNNLKPPVFSSLDSLNVVDWSPPPFPIEKGWTGGVVEWFNPNIGGKILCDDHEECFSPLTAIADSDGNYQARDGEFSLIIPRQPVLVRYSRGKRGRLAATVKPLY